ncbi:uncharacterized protein [Temnothorax longispinosus]|uniref:uncharacterized protein isoform X3 n=1 Tax=Temnothorax longispinosus TaxID=300112 RepID=UPI003A99E2AE
MVVCAMSQIKSRGAARRLLFSIVVRSTLPGRRKESLSSRLGWLRHCRINNPKAYEFGYSVKDQATGNDFGRQETSDGETVRGEYRVQLPDGRTQIVTYTADWRTGFHADVRYEGTATYPDQYNTGYNAGQGFGYQGNQIGGGGGFTGGNQGGYNYPQGGGHYNNANNYQFGANSLDSSYNNFGGRNYPGAPSPTYGPAFH